ncbi:histidine kinase (plasmid) [Embleya sp. NBC_00888]|uniref:sensor histidine kinase n=1 Tax=Embleya sp. NBC_00888 TaxID=2975960 RepID=UPI00386F821F|nr:histidine kinase [Embleya sp. NBC_00888]
MSTNSGSHDPRPDRPHWSWWAEAALVGTVTALSVQEAFTVSDGSFLHAMVVAALVSGLSLALRHRRPVPVALVAVAAAGCWGVVLPLLVVLFRLASRAHTKEAVGGVAAALAVNALLQPPTSLWATRTYGPALFLLLAVVLGLWAGNRRRLVEALATRVEHLRTERELREQAARLTERTIIAAEMHDVLAHRLSLIALHTGVLTTRKERLPDPVAERVALLRTASTEALADLRDVLGALRDPDAAGAAIAPTRAVREVEELIEQARDARQRVEATFEGYPGQAPAAHRLAVFRLVQEALTNARKHAPDAAVSIGVHYGPPATLVSVTNTAATRPVATVASGFGLVGLTERVEALGGRLTAGPFGAGAWQITARIPHPVTTNGPVTEQDGTHS